MIKRLTFVILFCLQAVLSYASLDTATIALWDTTGVSVRVYDNPVYARKPVISTTVPTLNFTLPVAELVAQPFSTKVTGTLPVAGWKALDFSCKFGSALAALFWVDGHLVCDTGIYFPTNKVRGVDNPLQVLSKTLLPLRLHLVLPAGTPLLQVDIQVLGTKINGGHAGIPLTSFIPQLPAVEKKREALQQGLLQGWGTWLHRSVLTVVKLPENYAFALSLCSLRTNECIRSSRISRSSARYIRVEEHAYDRSYAAFHLAHRAGCNITVELSGGAELSIGITATSSHSPADFSILLTGSCVWISQPLCEASTQTDGLKISQPGLQPVSLFSAQPFNRSLSAIPGVIAFNVPTTKSLVFTTQQSRLSTVNVHLKKQQALEQQRYTAFGELAETKRGIQAGLMWNLIHTPAELGPLFPVSHNWDFTPPSRNGDFSYVIFEWDNIFASYMLSLDAKELAYSNLIQVIKSKCSEGFVPNFSAASTKSLDRTEPPIGARVLLELYQRFEDKWLVELLFDDLLDWNNWFYHQRVGKMDGLVRLGGSTMQNARYESGLDNSPMYDGYLYDAKTGLMTLIDVGFSALVASESFALSQLAIIIKKLDISDLLLQRGVQLSSRVNETLWDDSIGIYVNRFINGSFHRRISPTSFYPMLAGIPSQAQAERMVMSWLQNSTRFCVSQDGNFTRNSEDCYWGLPSIQASDPAFPRLGYWRGFVWGPMAQLVYWGLANPKYKSSALIRRAKAALAKQMNALFLTYWLRKRHVCENYSPHRQELDCTGDHFYHWGGLTGFLSITESGKF